MQEKGSALVGGWLVLFRYLGKVPQTWSCENGSQPQHPSDEPKSNWTVFPLPVPRYTFGPLGSTLGLIFDEVLVCTASGTGQARGVNLLDQGWSDAINPFATVSRRKFCKERESSELGATHVLAQAKDATGTLGTRRLIGATNKCYRLAKTK